MNKQMYVCGLCICVQADFHVCAFPCPCVRVCTRLPTIMCGCMLAFEIVLAGLCVRLAFFGLRVCICLYLACACL